MPIGVISLALLGQTGDNELNKRLLGSLLLLGVWTNGYAQDGGFSSYHVFPQLAFGRLGDGSFYQSTLVLSNRNTSATTCTMRGPSGPSTVTLSPGAWDLFPNDASATFISGYLSVSCNNRVFANVLYSFN